MFNFSKIASELASSWDYFISEYKSQYSGQKEILSRFSFSEDFYSKLQKLINISYEDFIYLCCLQEQDFKSALNNQLKENHLTNDYIANTKPNKFVIKLFNIFKSFIKNKDLKFIKQYITELSFIYNHLDFAINKIKFVSNKLTSKDLKEIDNDTKVKLCMYSLIKQNKDDIKKFNEFLANVIALKKNIESVIEQFNRLFSNKQNLIFKSEYKVEHNFNKFITNYNSKNYEFLALDLEYLTRSLKNYIEDNDNTSQEQIILDNLNLIENLMFNVNETIRINWIPLFEGSIPYNLKNNFDSNLVYVVDLLDQQQIKQIINSGKILKLEDIIYALLKQNNNVCDYIILNSFKDY